jgi:Zn-dependent protease
MDLQHIDILNIVFQLIAFMFAISVHESAHAWMANLRGDPTARMLGRITLNPIKHIDLFGTLILPAVAMLAHLPVIGWAKPTPVDPRNFKNPVLDDILTSVVGPISFCGRDRRRTDSHRCKECFGCGRADRLRHTSGRKLC